MSLTRGLRFAAAACVAAASALCVPASRLDAADHGDAPTLAHDQGADVGDGFLFLDPNDNTRVFLGYTVRGFITPGEAVNFAFFDPAVRYRFEIENTGDEKPDVFIDVTFDQRVSATDPQTATVTLGKGIGGSRRARSFEAPATLPNLSATAAAPTITTDSESGAQFFAGPVDDPFVFDIPAFARFTASLRTAVAAGQGQGGANFTLLNRGRDTFAGYNIMAIAIELPLASLRDQDEGGINELGLSIVAQRKSQKPNKRGEFSQSGKFRTVDRTGNPALNAALIPINRRNAVNGATQKDDADGDFDADIAATATALGTSAENQQTVLNIFVRRGDYLRMNVNTPNTRTGRDIAQSPRQTSTGDGDNPEAAYPNGRRLSDDVIDTLLKVVANGADVSDNANTLDVPLRSEFPFFGPPHQPRDAGVIDDATRN
jgi:hypothetical protein